MGRNYATVDGKLNYFDWLKSLRDGRSYVTAGKSHLMDFKVNGREGEISGAARVDGPC